MRNYDLLLEYDLKIVGELTLRHTYHLIGHEGMEVDGIKRVYSHPQVFEQCREFLEKTIRMGPYCRPGHRLRRPPESRKIRIPRKQPSPRGKRPFVFKCPF